MIVPCRTRAGGVVALALLMAAGATGAADARSSTLDRLPDPVIVRTAMLGSLEDHRTAHSRLYRAHGGTLEPIPFQFDQRAEDRATPAPAGSPGSESGVHAAGYGLLRMTNIREPGSYDMNLAVIVLPRPYHPGDEVKPLAMLKEPLEIRIQRLA